MSFIRHALVNRECPQITKNLLLNVRSTLDRSLDAISKAQSRKLIDLIIDNRFISNITDLDLEDLLHSRQHVDRAVIRWHYLYFDETGLQQSGVVDTLTVSIGFKKNPVITCSGSDLCVVSNVVNAAQSELTHSCNLQGCLPD